MGYQPIRWDNVPGSSLSEASRPLDAAARAFDMGFGAIHNVLDQRSAIQDSNFQAGRTNATNEVMNRLMSADSVDAFKQAKQNLGATLDSYGAGIDQQAIRNFADQRGNVLQDRAIKDIAYNHAMLDETQAKDRDRIAGMLASGDKTQIDAAMKELPSMDLRVKADLYRNGNDAQRQLIDRAHADQEHDWKGQMNAASITHMANDSSIGFMNARSNQEQVKIAGRNASVNEANAMLALDDHLEARDAKYRTEYANTFKNKADSLVGQAVIDDAVASIKDPADQKQARIAASEILKKNPGITTNAVIASIKGIDQSWTLGILERSAAARNAAKLAANGTGAEDAKYAEELRKTLSAKIAANQVRRDGLTTGGLGLGDPGTGASTPAVRSVGAGTLVANPFGDAQSLNNPAQPAAPAVGAPSATAAPVQAPAAPVLPPAQQRLNDLMNQARNSPAGQGPTSADMFAAREAANLEARQMSVQQEADAKAAAKAEFMARAAEANKRNQAMMDRQSALNDKARMAQQQQAASRLDNKIADLQSNLQIYQKRGSVRDSIDIADTNAELAKVMAERERLKKLLGN
jgi:hypothetical protein